MALEAAQRPRGSDDRPPQRAAAEPRRVVAEQLTRETSEVIGADPGDLRERLVERQNAIVQRLLPADPCGEMAGLLHPQLEAAGQVRLGLVELVGLDDRVTERGE